MMNQTAGAAAYASVGVESAVMSATPYRLISMLFVSASSAIKMAGVHMQAGRMARKGECISRALDIVNNGLLAAIDMNQGGDIGARLASLYEYIARRLLEANLRNDADALAEAAGLLDEIASAWREIDPAKVAA
jgi:flagellar protein FliS